MITDELRGWKRNIQTYLSPEAVLQLRCEVNDIADRIDEECERRQEEAIDEVLGGLMKMTDEKMAENGWIRLPKDADGEYIHIGDVMDNTHKDGFRAKRVTGISYHEGGCATVKVDEGRLRWHDADKLHHHNEPTVEDVLLEMMRDAFCQFHDDGTCCVGLTDEQLAEYAQRLQLRDE